MPSWTPKGEMFQPWHKPKIESLELFILLLAPAEFYIIHFPVFSIFSLQTDHPLLYLKNSAQNFPT